MSFSDFLIDIVVKLAVKQAVYEPNRRRRKCGRRARLVIEQSAKQLQNFLKASVHLMQVLA